MGIKKSKQIVLAFGYLWQRGLGFKHFLPFFFIIVIL